MKNIYMQNWYCSSKSQYYKLDICDISISIISVYQIAPAIAWYNSYENMVSDSYASIPGILKKNYSFFFQQGFLSYYSTFELDILYIVDVHT